MAGQRAEAGDGKGAEISLEGTLERVIYANEDSAWSVVRLTVEGRAQPVTAVGNLLAVQPGERLRLRGQWVDDRRYGQQFRVQAYMTLKPETMLGIEKYLGSGMVPGIGHEIAKRLIESFGLETLEVIDKHPERLTEVEGIGPVRCQRIKEAWVEQRKVQEVMVFLQSYGVSSAFAVRIYKQYGERSIARVSDNPYRLASDVFGIGFRTADRIAADLGIARDSLKRVAAGVLHLLGEAADDGNVYCPLTNLREGALALLEVDEPLVDQAIEELAAARRIELEPLSGGSSERAVYLKALHVSESGAAERLLELLGTEPAAPSENADEAVAWFERGVGIELAEQQREALRRALASKVLVITGGPGTGKTTIITGIIRVLDARGQEVLCCAPTGRAAKRMNEATGHEAKTIHRLLEYSPRLQSFERNADNPLETDLVIVDETSMVDVVLLYNLLKAVPPACRLVLVGDVDQLPSVGPGSVLADLIRSEMVDVVRLTEIFRQAAESMIVLNAHRVNSGRLPVAHDPARGNADADELRDFYAIDRADPEQALATLKELIVTRIPTRFGVDPVDDVQVLTPMHKGTLGAANLNAELQALLNPDGTSLARGKRIYRDGDKVMQVRNNYQLEVFNGDIGRIVAIDAEERTVTVCFEGREVRYGGSELDQLVLAYACTIHKSQGSEYPVVVIPLHTQHYAMLQRNLLYTGITRGKRLVMLVGNRKAMVIAVNNNRVAVRHSRLAERLAGDEGVLIEPLDS